MNCGEARRQLEERFDLDSQLGAEVESHLDQCPVCQRHFDALQAFSNALGTLPGEPAPAGLEGKLIAAMKREWGREIKLRITALAAAALVTILLGLFYPLTVDSEKLGTLLESATRNRQWIEELRVPPSALLSYREWGEESIADVANAITNTMAFFEKATINSIWFSNLTLAVALAILAVTNGIFVIRMRASLQ